MSHTDKLIAYFRKIMPLTGSEEQAIADSLCIGRYKKGDLLLKEGQIGSECYFVLKGCVRQYYMIDGEEKTSNFYTEEQWVVSFSSFIQQQPADHYLECIEDTILVVGNEQREEEMYRTNSKFETISRMVLEKIISEQQALQARYVTDTPEQRYLYLLESNPQLVQRVPLYQLASYIGVMPESLSRIRKRITDRSRIMKA
jgi:CRP-like cAMP-binding protein